MSATDPTTTPANIESHETESRVFDPPPEFAAESGGAHVRSLEDYREMHRRSLDDTAEFWDEIAQEFDWTADYGQVVRGEMPDATWFVGGRTNLAHNCLDRIVNDGHGGKAALVWEGEPVDGDGPEVRTITYADLRDRVNRIANGLRALGVGKGDVVTIYLPMIPDAVAAMLACARIGAPHSVIFAGFSANAIADRMKDADSKIILTSDGARRRGKVLPLKETVDEALAKVPGAKCVVFRHIGAGCPMTDGRDVWADAAFDGQQGECPSEEMDSEDPLFVLYTSGSTGKPKGILHTTGGYMAWAYLTTRLTFDMKPGDLFWCTADVGWITGHTYVTYGPLLNGGTVLLYEGAPNFPDFGRFWDIVERHKVTTFYTAPTAIRAFMKAGDDLPSRGTISSSLRLLGTVGEPINPEAWMWFRERIGGGAVPHRRHLVADRDRRPHDHAPARRDPDQARHRHAPLPRRRRRHRQRAGRGAPPQPGRPAWSSAKPWPGMLRGVLGDRQRFLDTYFSKVPGAYFSGDGARRDADGYFWVMGRIDDVLNVSGHRLGTAEVESALVAHPAVAEAAVVGYPHEIKGEAVAAYVTLKPGHDPDDALRDKLRRQVADQIGAIAKPDQIRFADALPKTRSGKIMRRLLRDIAAGRDVTGDTTTLEDRSVIDQLLAQDG